ncbi:FxsA family protein [Pararhodospirillum photometricum]|nr:FxsA family protein [Pararhodospirillum photometricum]
MAFLVLFLIFVGVPVIEISLFIKVGSAIGVVPTVALTLLTAVAGTMLVRHQGVSTLEKARESVNAGILPVQELFDGACILIGGILLLVPGFFTDIWGILLLLPPVRAVLRQWLEGHQGMFMTPAGPASPTASQPQVIDAEYLDVTAGGVGKEENPWARPADQPPKADR